MRRVQVPLIMANVWLLCCSVLFLVGRREVRRGGPFITHLHGGPPRQQHLPLHSSSGFPNILCSTTRACQRLHNTAYLAMPLCTLTPSACTQSAWAAAHKTHAAHPLVMPHCQCMATGLQAHPGSHAYHAACPRAYKRLLEAGQGLQHLDVWHFGI
jgi:hypothetical protein